MRSSLDAAWEEKTSQPSPCTGGEINLSIPIPASPTELFRLKGTVSAAPELVSPELKYVVIPSLASNSSQAVFHFKGIIDGSDRIFITRAGALWEHVNWDWPQGSVTVNGNQWDSRQKNYITSPGVTRFLPESFSLDSAQLQVTEGRDVVALERTPNGVMVYMDDTFSGADEYEFTIQFQPVAEKAKSKKSAHGRIKLAAQIDGSDLVRITSSEAVWEHGTFSPPLNVRLNGIAWDPTASPVLKNEGTNAFLPAGVDFATAKIISRKGRDVATMWAEESSILVRFADNPNDSDDYEIDIAFGE